MLVYPEIIISNRYDVYLYWARLNEGPRFGELYPCCCLPPLPGRPCLQHSRNLVPALSRALHVNFISYPGIVQIMLGVDGIRDHVCDHPEADAKLDHPNRHL